MLRRCTAVASIVRPAVGDMPRASAASAATVSDGSPSSEGPVDLRRA